MEATGEEWTIQEVAREAGVTSRTLRHYDAIGLLPPARVGGNGYRYYDAAALVRLQRILLLRETGLGLAAIAEVLEGERDAAAALRAHLDRLEEDRERLRRRVASVRTTLRALEEGAPLMAKDVFDGFDHARHEDEVVERWGKEAWNRGDAWWRSLSEEEKHDFHRTHVDIARDFGEARAAGRPADGEEARAIARRLYDWIRIGWQGRAPSADAFVSLGEMYVADPRFARNYDRHGEGTAAYVRDAMAAYAERELR